METSIDQGRAVSQVLWRAAADVEQRGVCRPPRQEYGETCAMVALNTVVEAGSFGMDPHVGAEAMLRIVSGVQPLLSLAEWNDAQPSRAVVAAAMRDAAVLAEWAGDHLLGSER